MEGYKRRLAWELRRLAVLLLVVMAELAVAAAPATLTAAVLLPVAHRQRGGWAVGGEWLLIGAVFCVGYYIVHNRVCDKLFEEG